MGFFKKLLAGLALIATPMVAQLQPSDFEYVGAFAVETDYTMSGNAWNRYGMRGLTHDPSGDPGNADAFPGSLWITGHDYESWVTEISIPVPSVTETSWSQLPQPEMLTEPLQFMGACDGPMEQFPGVEVHKDKIWGGCVDMYNVTGGDRPEVLWNRNLSDLSNLQGAFHAGPVGVSEFHSNRQGKYVVSVPDDWANAHLGGKTLATGFARNAHGGSMGPTLLPFDPDNPSDGYDLLWYRHRHNGDIENCYADQSDCDYPSWTACDKWNDATWVRTEGSDTVLIGGEKFDGTFSDYTGGGWTCGTGFGEIIFYDSADFEARISGSKEPWEIVPDHRWNPSELWGDDHAIAGMAFDQANGYLYFVEHSTGPFGRVIIHAYQVGDVAPPPPPVCGDGNCDAGEDPNNCPQDCGPPPPVCGDGLCEAGEDCPIDCDPVCGDGVCEVGEDCLQDCCPECPDCPPPVACDSCCPAPPACDSCCPTLEDLLPDCPSATVWSEDANGDLELTVTWDCP